MKRYINDIVNANKLNFNYGEWEHMCETYKNIEETTSIVKIIRDYPLYTENYIFDENKSVKWNKDEVIKRNKLRDEEIRKGREIRKQALCDVENNIIHCIAVELIERNIIKADTSTAVEKAIKIFNFAWDKGHSYGIYEVCIYIDEIIDFIEGIIK